MNEPAGTTTIEGHLSQSWKTFLGIGAWANVNELQMLTRNAEKKAAISRMVTPLA
jgi:hypothetical protein